MLLWVTNPTSALWEMEKSITTNTCSHVGMCFGLEDWLLDCRRFLCPRLLAMICCDNYTDEAGIPAPHHSPSPPYCPLPFMALQDLPFKRAHDPITPTLSLQQFLGVSGTKFTLFFFLHCKALYNPGSIYHASPNSFCSGHTCSLADLHTAWAHVGAQSKTLHFHPLDSTRV